MGARYEGMGKEPGIGSRGWSVKKVFEITDRKSIYSVRAYSAKIS